MLPLLGLARPSDITARHSALRAGCSLATWSLLCVGNGGSKMLGHHLHIVLDLDFPRVVLECLDDKI